MAHALSMKNGLPVPVDREEADDGPRDTPDT
jgi:hypothetical protein